MRGTRVASCATLVKTGVTSHSPLSTPTFKPQPYSTPISSVGIVGLRQPGLPVLLVAISSHERVVTRVVGAVHG